MEKSDIETAICDFVKTTGVKFRKNDGKVIHIPGKDISQIYAHFNGNYLGLPITVDVDIEVKAMIENVEDSRRLKGRFKALISMTPDGSPIINFPKGYHDEIFIHKP